MWNPEFRSLGATVLLFAVAQGQKRSGAQAAIKDIPSFPACRFCAMEWPFLLVRVK